MKRAARQMGALVAALCLAACSAGSQEPPIPGKSDRPARIVSTNPCVDAILREVAAPEQIAGISHYSHDARATSVPLDWARRYPAVTQSVEDVIARRPDLVITSGYVPPQMTAALERLGIPLLRLDLPNSVAESKEDIAWIAAAIGRAEQGRALDRHIAVAVQELAARQKPSALVLQEEGLVLGTGTLTDELLHAAGFRNAAEAMGIRQWGVISLEDVLAAPPAIIMTSTANMKGDRAGAGRLLSHPALRKAERDFMIADLPTRLLHCGGPSIIGAAERLKHIRRAWLQREAG